MMSRDAFVAHQRVYRFLVAARPTLGSQITAAELARALVRDGGPIPDIAQLAAPLRAFGFRRVRQRRGPRQRVMTWLLPATPINRGGRPRRPAAGA
jgi:hypothetical protein